MNAWKMLSISFRIARSSSGRACAGVRAAVALASAITMAPAHVAAVVLRMSRPPRLVWGYVLRQRPARYRTSISHVDAWRESVVAGEGMWRASRIRGRSLVPKRNDRFDAHRAPRGQPARDDADRDDDQNR